VVFQASGLGSLTEKQKSRQFSRNPGKSSLLEDSKTSHHFSHESKLGALWSSNEVAGQHLVGLCDSVDLRQLDGKKSAQSASQYSKSHRGKKPSE